MNLTNFVFPPPPPPPPPPPSVNLQNYQNYQSTSQQSQFQGNAYNGSNRRGQNDGYGRGAQRGRGDPCRGSRDGSNRGFSGYGGDTRVDGCSLASPGGYNNRRGNYRHSNGHGHRQAEQFQHGFQGQRSSGFSSGPQVLSYGGPVLGAPYPSSNLTSLNLNLPSTVSPQTPGYRDQHGYLVGSSKLIIDAPAREGNQSPNQPVNMTPHSLEPGPSVYLNSVSPTASMPSHRQLGQKRTYSGASVMGRKAIPRDAAPPAVPEFGTKPVIPSLPSQGKGPKLKKKRKHNQLGLTPKTEEHESSEEEQDMDEELKLAAAQPSVALGYLEFSYKGRVATLRSSSEIAAWIEERKKRYPTKKRAEEEARRKENLRQAERTAAELGTKKSKAGKAEYDKKRINVADVAKARQKAEKLRKKYQKAERRVAEIEAETLTKTNVLEDDVSQRQKCGFGRNVEDMSSSDTLLPAPKPDDGTGSKTTEARSVQSPSKQNTDLQESFEHPASLLPEDGTRPEQWTVDQHPNDSLSKPCIPDVKLPSSICEKPPVPEILLGNHDASVPSDTLISMVLNDRDLLEDLDNASLSDSSELSPSGEDDTSSSGSSTDSNSPPEVYPKRIESDCAVPQNFAKKKSICKLFLSKGFCSRGDRCQYLHELPKRGSGKLASSKNGNTEGTPRTRLKKERTSLYQRILMQQEEKEDELALEHIILLGENGALDDQKAGN